VNQNQENLPLVVCRVELGSLYPLCAVPHREQVLRFIGAPEAPTLSETVTPQRQTMSEEMFFAPATSKARRIEVR
jgi:hypothetical protein